MDAALKSMLVTTITKRSVTARSAYGDETLGAAVTVPCFIENQREYVAAGKTSNPNGGSELRVYPLVVCETEILLSDRIWLEDEDSNDETISRRPVRVNKCYEPENPKTISHYEVEL